ncbi:hypothetical protein CALVIDRAFT_540926 [Calocera viscosa TUFC12733]|uniref:Uncharacterized protein n=1 Tax=Calocera viscosa (strain TUFC12733) TaxID=1330018 RepID=A0A167IB03_CALVF|nr:hypothetical protein CALVIDRAFT_540926 [Calocera viscosa TUFC12733]
MADIISSYTPGQLLSTLAATSISDDLKLLHSRVRISLPTDIRARSPAYLTLAELTEILSYKLAIGVNRPFLKGMLKKNSDASVRAVSTRAFAVAGLDGVDTRWEDLKSALDIIFELTGVGPALGTLVFSLLYPKGVPFFSDETAVELLKPTGGRHGLKYSVKEYKLMWDELGALVEKINARGEEGSGRVGRGDVERAIWTLVRHSAVDVEGESQGAKATKSAKRKAKDEDEPIEAPPKVAKRTRSSRKT